ncbi:VOC family protein [Paenibacillus spongiae]|uniref:VOC family protein n=1 Tax=Paenibacillus spongiae TaxID=2909671 RepID=A0ABY5SGX8_9BACL|nr:VOC family protein [Paenibacillus spongiae]UVI33019.1 VOC family protein [Paenibacillus spongiae]
MRLTPYLTIDGNAREAIQFYEETLEAKILEILTFAEMTDNPDSIPEGAKDRIAHALLQIGESELMLSDSFPGAPLSRGNHITVCITLNSIGRSKQVFEALQQGGQVKMALQETNFSPAFGEITDKFGITFLIYTDSQS